MRVLILASRRSARSENLEAGLIACGIPAETIEDVGDDEAMIAAGFHGSNPMLPKRVVAHDRAFARAAEIEVPVWLVEDDVEWRSPQAAARWMLRQPDADLVGFDITPKLASRDWQPWSLVRRTPIDSRDAWRGFFVACRLSPRLCRAVAAYAGEHRRLAFFEAMLPTLAARAGMSMHSADRGKSIVRWRPEINDAEAAAALEAGAVLLHPRKQGLA